MNPDNKIPLSLPDLGLVFVQGGDFLMGTSEDDPDNYGDEHPVHKVTISSFYMAKYPVTQALWLAVMEENPSYFQGEKRPVETVFWNDAQTFIKKLNERTGERYRLPSEAEWEFAARGGIYGQGHKYAGSNKLKEVSWYGENSHDKTKPVGLKFPNELGLYDMSGNIWEWCQDVWHGSYEGATKKGSAWITGGDQSIRVARGGAWSYDTVGCRVAVRFGFNTDIRYIVSVGFRLAR